MGWIVTAMGVVAIAVGAIQPENRSPFFWYRVIWAVFLAFLVWSSGGAFFVRTLDIEKRRDGLGAILPSLALVVSSYAGVSFCFMLLFMCFSQGDTPNRFHLILQVFFGAATGVVCVFLSLAKTAASNGLSRIPQGVELTASLASRLEDQERRLSAMGLEMKPCMIEVKALRETIKYSLPGIGSIAASNRYELFSEDVARACRDLASLSPESEGLVTEHIDELRALQRQAKAIADELKS